MALSLEQQQPGEPLESVDQLTRYFIDACKPREHWRLGTEHELIGVSIASSDYGAAIPYAGDRGIRAILDAMMRGGWSPIVEGDTVIALDKDGAQLTLEPGGQVELASRPVSASGDYERDLSEFMDQLTDATRPMELAWLCIGFRPFGTINDVYWMPKGRYDVMRDYLPSRGRLAHEMMKRTATVQTNLDYSDADDAGAKLRCAMSITSILTALYANSPIVDEAVSGYQSYRARIWQEVDPARCGLLEFVFEDGDVFDAYAEWALDVPMFFVQRSTYIPARGMTFRQFMRDGFDGHRATMDDWALHLSTLFPETRMKQFLEVRGCDSGCVPMVQSLGPLCRGLLYDDDARAAATALTASLSFGERVELGAAVARDGLKAALPGGGVPVGELAKELVSIASDGLARQAPDELRFLDPLRHIVATGRTRADAVLDAWKSADGDRAHVIEALTHEHLSFA